MSDERDAALDAMQAHADAVMELERVTKERDELQKTCHNQDVDLFLLRCRAEEMQWIIRDLHNGDGESSDEDVERALKLPLVPSVSGYVRTRELEPTIELLRSLAKNVFLSNWTRIPAELAHLEKLQKANQ